MTPLHLLDDVADSSLRSRRYFAGQCISCGDPNPAHCLHPHPTMADCRTHCTTCGQMELASRARDRRKGWPSPTFTIMLVRHAEPMPLDLTARHGEKVA